MKKILLFLSFLLMSIGIWGAASTLTFTSSCSGNGTANDGAVWTVSSDAAESSFDNTKGIHYGTGSKAVSYLRLTTSDISGTITQIVVNASGASGTSAKLNITVGGSTFGSEKSLTSSATNYTLSGSLSGEIIVNITQTSATKALYCKSIAVTYSDSSPTTYTITYDSAGVTSTETCSSTTLKNLQTPSSCSDLGWSFAGWSESNSDFSDLKIGEYSPTSNIRLYAVYRKTNSETTTESYGFENPDNMANWSIDGPIQSSDYHASGSYSGCINTNNTYIKYKNKVKVTNFSFKFKRNSNNNNYNVYVETSTDGSAWTTAATYAMNEFDYNGSTFTSKSKDFDGETELYIRFHCYNTTAVRYVDDISITYSGGYDYSLKPDCSQPTPCDSVTINLFTSHGSASLSKEKICQGEFIEITNIAPDEGYELDTIACIDEDGNDVGSINQETHTISGINKDCYVLVIFKEILEPHIDIAVWDTGYVKITIDNFNAATALLEDKDTQHTQEKKVATELFFSKYFEAAGNNKMLAIYNGTKDTINLKQYTFRIAKINTTPVNLGNYGNYQDTLMLPNTEILFVHYDETNSAKDCADDIEGYQNWVEVPGSGNLYSHMNFGGRASIGLYKNSSLIDIIGIHNGSEPLQMNKSCTYAKINGLNDDEGFYTYSGDNIKTEEVETNYFLSTNRCMLVRKNTVKDGSNAVTRNYHNGTNDECNDTIALQFKTLAQEWMGYQIGNGNNSQALTDSTCSVLAYAGHYNYGNYYAQFAEIVSDTALSQIIDSDSTYKFTYNFTDLSCTELKVIVKDTTDKNNIKSHEETFRIPIFIYNNSTVKSFKEKNCKECDVVVIGGGVLNVDTVELESRNVTVYPGGRLIVPVGKEYKMNSLTLRRDNNDVPHLLNNGTIALENDSNYFFELRTDASDWRWTTLPASHKVSDIKENNGKRAKLNSEVYVRHYNGKARAINHRNGWEDTSSDSIFSPGQGFLFGIDLDGTKKKIYRFKFPNAAVNSESSPKIVTGLRAWGCNDKNLAPNHKGWNLIGNPFADNDTTDIITPIKAGELVKDSTSVHWNGKWVYRNGSEIKNLRYAVIPVTWRAWTADEEAAGGYASELLDDYVLLPFTSFFVQIGGDENTNQSLTFNPIGTNPINRIVARNYNVQEDEEVFLRVRVGERKTGCFISNKFTDEYEPGDDLESRYPIYQSIGGYKLLYSAINDSIIEHGVQITAPQGTLYLDPKVDVNKFEYIYVNYNDSWSDLMHGETVNIESGSFILQAKRKSNNVATGLDAIPTNGVYKFSDGNNIYINRNNTMFNIIGSKVK